MDGASPVEGPVLEFRLLGPLEAWRDGRRLHLGGERQRALLALLLLHPNETVSTGRLVEELFGGGGDPDGGLRALRVAVSRLRRLLGDGADDGDGGGVLLTRPGGYLLALDDGALDVARFDALVAAARGGGDALGRSVALRDALALWRGPPLADLAGLEFAQAEIRRLEEVRLSVLMDRIDADLALGRAGELIGEIETLVAAHPYVERLRAALMLALYRAGRQADALAAYRSTSELLREELGLEPGRALRELEQAILVHDPALELAGGGPADSVPAAQTVASPADADADADADAARRASRRRRRAAFAGGALALTGALAAGLALSVGGGGAARQPAVLADAVYAIDPRSGVAATSLRTGDRPTTVALAPDEVWVLNADDGTVAQVDPLARSVDEVFATARAPTAIVAERGSLWVADAGSGALARGSAFVFAVTRYDPVRRQAIATTRLPYQPPAIPFGGAPAGQSVLVAGAGYLWALAPDERVVQLDAANGRIVRRLRVQAVSLAFGDGQLWAIDADGRSLDRVDVRTGRLARQIPIPGYFGALSIAVGGGDVWLATAIDGTLWKIEPGPPQAVTSIPLGTGAGIVAYGDGAVWIGNDVTSTVSRLDPTSGRITATAHVPSPQAIAIGDGAVWATSGSAGGRSGPLREAGCAAPAGPADPDVRLASDLALHANWANYALPQQRAILRVLERDHFRAGRFTVGYQACDDGTPLAAGADDSRCTANTQDYGADVDVVAVIGPSSSECASFEIPVASRARAGPLALVTPAATAAQLSRHVVGLPPELLNAWYPHGVGNFMRTIPDDHIQVAADAELLKTLGGRRVAVVFDRGGFTSQGELAWFRYAARHLGGLDAIPVEWTGGAPARVVATLRARHVDAVFVTGGLSSAAESQLSGLFDAVHGVFGSGFPIAITDWQWPWWYFAQVAGAAGNGVYASSPGNSDPSLVPASDRALVRSVGGPAYAVAPAVAATEAVMDAIARSNGTRRSVLAALKALRLSHSAVGPIAFDRAGELASGPVTIFRIDKGAHNSSGLYDFQNATFVRVITPPRSILAPP